MAENSKIQWTDATWNPWHGCKKVSPGCKYCYMYRDKDRYGQDPTTVLRSKSTFNAPLKWSQDMQMGLPKGDAFTGMKIFTCSWSDFFIEEADEWRPEAWEIIKKTPEFTYQILTKRPGRINYCLPPDWDHGYDNVWLGVSIESDEEINRAFLLHNVKAKAKFISAEPLIGAIDKFPNLFGYGGLDLDWLIIGGESGNKTGKYLYRACSIGWIEELIWWCNHLSVPVFVKQLGSSLADELGLKDKFGGDISEWPLDLQVRQFPRTVSA